MIRHDSQPDSADVIIWVSSVVMALVLGVGASSYLWTQTHSVAQPALLAGAIAGLTLGLACIAASFTRRLPQAIILLFALALSLGFFLLAPNLIHTV